MGYVIVDENAPMKLSTENACARRRSNQFATTVIVTG